MSKINKRRINIFLIFIAIFLLTPFYSNCEPKYTLNLACGEPLWTDSGIPAQTFKSAVEYLTNGDIYIHLHPSGEWGGGSKDWLSGIQLNTLDMLITTSSILSQYTDALYLFDVPFLFKNSLDPILLSFKSPTEHTQLMKDALEKASQESKMKVLSATTTGRRDIFSNKPIESIEDIQGLKIRVISNPVQVDAFNYMGLKATPLPYGEVYNSLRLKMIDAAENSPNAYIEMRFVEGAPYYVLTDHLSNGIAIFMSYKAWDSLPGSYQRIIEQCAVGAMNASSLWGLGASDYYLKGEVNESAKKMVIVTPEEKHILREKVLPKLLDKYSESIGIDVLEFLAENDEVIANWLERNKSNE